MKAKLKFLLSYGLLWLLLFLLGKVTFLLYQHTLSFQLPPKDWFGIFIHGFRLDLSTSGYIMLFPCLVLALTTFFKGKAVRYILHTYTGMLLVAFLLITLVDLEIYKYWGTRLDSAPLRFLNTPKDTLASSSLITLVLYFSSFVLFSALLYWAYLRWAGRFIRETAKTGFTGLFVFLAFTAAMILPIRGGIGVSVINTGSAFFHKNNFVNHAAINVVWNFGHSIVEKKEAVNPYAFYKEEKYQTALINLYSGNDSSIRLIKAAKPNIILLILESFSAKLIEPLGGASGVTPEFNSLCPESVLFSNIYATDSRTDKGLATILSGYPVLEAIPVLKYPEKTQRMPFLSKSLEQFGYHATFTYGGDVDFANMRSYLVNGNFTNIITDNDFPASQRTSKWGVPDHIVFNRFLEECKSDTGSWLKVMLSLSNHEPFEIPVEPKFGDHTLTEKFHSSAFYTDSCLGDFVRRYKETGLWDNTLIIMVADHGTRVPDYSQVYEPRKFHIPILWTGGALTKDTVVTKLGSQADLAITLLHQLNIPTGEYILGKDLLSPAAKSFVFYSYKNGIAMLTDSSGFGFDFNAKQFSFSYGKTNTAQVEYAKTLQQYVFENYLRLSDQSVVRP